MMTPLSQAPAYLGLAALYAAIVFGTKSTFFGDTYYYTRDIAAVLTGERPATSLLEFGHLFWRPLGALVTSPGGESIALLQRTASNLISINVGVSAMCVAAMWMLLRSIDGIRPAAAFLACAAFMTTNGFINLSRSGTAWLPGLLCVLVACSCAIRATHRQSWRWAAVSAAAVAAAVVLWVPYVLSALAVAVACLLAPGEIPGKRPPAVRYSLVILAAAGILVLSAYSHAMWARHIGTLEELRSWIIEAGHGEGRSRQLARLLFGLPRSFLIMGDDGALWKQFIFQDPYAGVTLLDLIRASLWKVAVFYLAMAAASFELLRVRARRVLLAWILAGVVPTVVLAVLFEAGSVERYLAAYPAVFVAIAYLLSQPSCARWVRVTIIGFCGVMILNNTLASSVWSVDRQRARTMARIHGLPASGYEGVVVYTLNVRDDLSAIFNDPMESTVKTFPRVKVIMPALAGDVPQWRISIGRTLLDYWDRGGEIWMTRRAWSPTPDRSWLWAEGDDWRVRWTDIRNLAGAFAVDKETGGPDGFRRLADTPANQARAQALITDGRNDPLE